MTSNVLRLEPRASAAVKQVEPIEWAVREVSARVTQNAEERRRREGARRRGC